MVEGREHLVRRLAELRESFSDKLADRLKILDDALREITPGMPPATAFKPLNTIALESHKLVGSAATFGFQGLSDRARLLEDLTRVILGGGSAITTTDRDSLKTHIANLDRGRREGTTRSVVEAAAWDYFAGTAENRPSPLNRVIVVEDDEEITQILGNQLPHFGYAVTLLDNPDKLAAALAEGDPAVVLMDIAFPDDSDAGVNAVRRLRAAGTLAAPVIFMSIRDDLEARIKAVRAGCDGYLTKPVDMGELLDLVKRLTFGSQPEKFRVLLVDDDPEISGFYSTLLENAGVETRMVNDPFAVMGPMRELKPDLVLMDIQMPDCSGFELAQAIRQSREFVQMPIVFLSGSNVDGAWLKSLQSGGDEFLKKSQPAEEFLTSTMARLHRARDLGNTLRRLHDSEDRFRAVVETANEAIVTTDLRGRIIFWNQSAEQLFGYGASEILGHLVEELVPDRHRPILLEQFQQMRAHSAGSAEKLQQTREATILRRDGGEVPVELSLSDWFVGQQHFFTGVIRDISARKESERLIRKAQEQAEAANRAKSEFLSSMSHELRTPLNAILGFSQLLEGDPLTNQQHDYIRMIRESGQHLLTLIDEVLDLARIEAGRVDMSLEPVPTDQIISESLDMLRSLATKKHVTLQEGPQVQQSVLVDRTRFRQVVINLLSNAIKYNRHGGTVRIETHNHEPGHLRLTVRDTGLGIPEDRQAELFEPFNRLGAEATDIEGTGIGLSLTRQLVELMGGHIDFRSTEGEGTSFWIDLPVAATRDTASAETAAPVPAPPLSETNTQSKARTILYVEDNRANLTLMTAIVSRIPEISLISASNAEDGLRLAETEKPDLILMDINLPGMNGYQALEHLRAMPETSSIPVIALTAGAMADDIARGKQAGFADYLTKPIDVKTMLASMRGILEH